MRLKYLFFPVILVLSLIIIVGYVWPEIQTIQQEKGAYAQSAALLAAVKGSQNNIQSIDADLTANSDKSGLVMAYLPQAKSEERIVDSLNYLASGAGLSVINIGLDKDSAPVAVAAPVVAPLTSLNGQTDGSSPASAAAPATPMVDSLKVSSANAHVTVVGEYDKLLMYTDQLQRMGMDAAITKITIAPQQAAAAPGAASQNSATPLLTADITIGFNWAPALKNTTFDSNNFTSASFDFTPVDKLQAFISQPPAPSALPQIQATAAGKTNPFLP